MTKIYQNAFYVPEVDKYFESSHVHCYVSYKFSDGKEYDIDGGREYFRRGGNFELLNEGKVIDFSLTEDNTKEEIYSKLLWGTRGPNGDKPLTYRPIREFTLDHLCAIRDNCPYAMEIVKETVSYWIKDKNEN